MRHRLEVLRLHTCPVTAEVVDFVTRWDWADVGLIGEPMRHPCFALKTKPGVAQMVEHPGPLPAPIRGQSDALSDAFAVPLRAVNDVSHGYAAPQR
jgi:hypothetical protein